MHDFGKAIPWHEFIEQTHYVWVDTGEGGETAVLPFKAISRLEKHHFPVLDVAADVRLGYVESEWWWAIGRPYVESTPNAIVRAAGGGNAEDALERFVQNAEYWFEGLPN